MIGFFVVEKGDRGFTVEEHGHAVRGCGKQSKERAVESQWYPLEKNLGGRVSQRPLPFALQRRPRSTRASYEYQRCASRGEGYESLPAGGPSRSGTAGMSEETKKGTGEGKKSCVCSRERSRLV